MIKKLKFISAGLVLFSLGSLFDARSQNTVPCLIFSGKSETSRLFDLSVRNRVTFNEAGMQVTSCDASVEPIQLLYSEFHHIEVGEGVPSVVTGNDELSISGENSLAYISSDKVLTITSPSSYIFNIGIFNINGVLIATSEMTAGQQLSVELLEPGIYLAVAVNDDIKLSLKFKIN